MRLLLLAIVLAGCPRFEPQVADSDAAGDAPPLRLDAFDPACFGEGDFYFCMSEVPTGPVLIDDANLDTTACNPGAGIVQMIGGVEVCVIPGVNIMLTGVINTFGSRPLVIVSATDLTLFAGAVIDASSRPSVLGPAANDASCDSSGGVSSTAGGSGGGGGSFGTAGGKGGDGDADAAVHLGGTAGAPVATVTSLRGGCPGGAGGAGTTGAAASGAGGGAVYLVARNTLGIGGTIDASGAGARGGSVSNGGGGGGGSGGLIVLHAATLVVEDSGRIVANGGGGGGGAGNSTAGDAGTAPDPDKLATPALGGQNTVGGATRGGDGAASSIPATAGFSGASGGGGGGGGLGVIRVLGGGTIPTGNSSPDPS